MALWLINGVDIVNWRPGLDSWPLIGLCMEDTRCHHCDERQHMVGVGEPERLTCS